MLDDSQFLPAQLMLAYAAYALGTASPGPSNMAIMGLAMNAGRTTALVFALGVVCGSMFWGVLAALGLSAVFATYAHALFAMKIFGGLYLLWLASKSARSALRNTDTLAPVLGKTQTSWQTFCRGTLMHLTNPKAIFVWLSIVSLAMPAQYDAKHALYLLAGCLFIGVLVFGGYALLFSTAAARHCYQKSRRLFDAVLALTFAFAGFKLLSTRQLA
jgi:threonine efflux protein